MTRFTIEGLDELREELKRLPYGLVASAAGKVSARARSATERVRAGYPARTGDLRKRVSVSIKVDKASVVATVKNTAPHAWMFENGTQARHTAIGANRGAMPPGHVFVPAVIKRRREMYDRLRGMMRGHGLKVVG